MEYVKVKYPTCESVYIDGKKNGNTGEVLRVARGFHTFDLRDAAGHQPSPVTMLIKKTSVLEPRIIVFPEELVT